MREIPSRPVLGPQGAAQLIGGDALFRFRNQSNGEKPLGQGQVGVVVDGACGGGELEAAIVALVELARLASLALGADAGDAGGVTSEALDPIGPALAFQVLPSCAAFAP
jgi:hypothetical protein